MSTTRTTVAGKTVKLAWTPGTNMPAGVRKVLAAHVLEKFDAIHARAEEAEARCRALQVERDDFAADIRRLVADIADLRRLAALQQRKLERQQGTRR